MILLHQKHLLVKHGRYPPSSQESTSDPFSPATGGECLTCGAALSGTRQWRSSNTTSSQLCDSCANYSKMNRPPGSTSTSGGRGSPPSRSKSGAAPPPTGNRRTGMNCANCRCVELFSLLSKSPPIAARTQQLCGGETTPGSQCATLADSTSNCTASIDRRQRRTRASDPGIVELLVYHLSNQKFYLNFRLLTMQWGEVFSCPGRGNRRMQMERKSRESKARQSRQSKLHRRGLLNSSR